ncbi:MAG: DUF4097 family beta strand repeat-containing protein [Bryobacteraceae bacterium]|nr:DUF4097 family beta strand repeat-containing protein [Bryobacteraceae bacterium]
MKRASLIAPLIVIAIGVLFLINNLRPELSVWRLIAGYWPWVLVGWGAIRTVEILYSWQQGQVLPQRGVSGGEWAFIIFLSIFGMGTSAAGRITNWPGDRFNILGWNMVGETYDFPLHGEQSADGVKKIVLENLRGNARLVGGDGNAVKVDGRTIIRALDRATAERANARIPLSLSRQGDVLYIRTSQERWTGQERLSAELDIALPRNVSVECKGRYGDFDVTGITGAVDVDSDNAGVRLNDIGSARIEVRRSDTVRAANVKGTVEVKGRGEDLDLENIAGQVTVDFRYTGDLRFRQLAKPIRFRSDSSEMAMERINGEVRMTRGEIDADDFTGPAKIVVRSRSRDLKLSNFSQSLEIDLDRGDIELRPNRQPMAMIEARTRSGAVTLAMPSKAGFQLSATTKRGEYENEFGAPLTSGPADRGGIIQGTTGAGPKINVSTDRGSLTVLRSTGETSAISPVSPPSAPVAPLPPLPKTLPKVEQQ